MKKCPYCSAELLDNADFCLYCMRSLDKKQALNHSFKKPYLKYVIIGICAVLFIGSASAFIAVRFKHKSAKNNISNQENTSSLLPGTDSPVYNGEINGNGYDNFYTKSNISAAKNKASSENTESEYNGASDYSVPADTGNNGKSSVTASGGSKYKTSDIEKSEESNDCTPSSSDVISNPVSSAEQSVISNSGEQKEEPVQVWTTRNVNGGIEITGIKTHNSTGNYEVPSQIDGKNVVGIGQQAFNYEKSIKNITLPETLTYIDDKAFANCNALTKIVIPKNVTRIGVNAFLPCENLSAVYIASKNISIGSYAFSDIYHRSVSLTIYAPAEVIDKASAKAMWSADYKEWNG